MAEDKKQNNNIEKSTAEGKKPAVKQHKPWSVKKYLLLMVLLLAVFAAVPVLNEYIPQKVRVEYIGFDGNTVKAYDTCAHKIDEFKGEHADEIAGADVCSVRGDDFITNGMSVRVVKASPATAKIGGKKKKINNYPGTVEYTLLQNRIKYDEDDIIEPAADRKMSEDTVIKVTKVKVVTEEKVLPVEPKEKDAVFDKSIASGTIVRTTGKPGKATYTFKHKYVNGKKIKTSRSFKEWVKKPVDIQLKFGTSVTGETGPAEYGETFTGNCTAYYAGNNAHGAIGQRCYYGTCAVDPKVIPYGTKLYVEGYGTAIANDCGGAVKGHIIDLYMRSTRECFQWGRRNKKVYILK